MPLRTTRCAVENLERWYPRLFLEPHSVACVAVLSRSSGPPATFEVACEGSTSRWLDQDKTFRLKVSWGEETAAKAGRLLARMQQKPVVEMASVALAFILARRLLALGQLDLNDYGERADCRRQAPSACSRSAARRTPRSQGAGTGRRWRKPSTTPTVGAPASSSVPSRPEDIASGFHDTARRRNGMAKAKARPYPPALLELMESKTAILMKARTFGDLGMAETAQPIWLAAASLEERIAPLLDALGRNLEAAASRISAASCYQKGGDLSRATNLYQAALAAPLRANTRRDVAAMLAGCLDELSRTALNGASRREGNVPAGT
jgi:hypothetical protein